MTNKPTSMTAEYARGREDEKQSIKNVLNSKGYDWTRGDNEFSPLQMFLNWLGEQKIEDGGAYATGRESYRNHITALVTHNAYDWTHDKSTSAVQNLLNAL